MKYQICYFDRTENNKQILEEFDSYNEFEKVFLRSTIHFVSQWTV